MSGPTRIRVQPAARRVHWVWAVLLCATPFASGCYNGDALVERIRSRAISTRLEEIDLGHIRVTLPRDAQIDETVEMHVHLFAHAARHKIDDLKEELELKSFLINDELLTTFRNFTSEDLADPELNRVRDSVLATMNELLDEPVLSSLGLYDFYISRH